MTYFNVDFVRYNNEDPPSGINIKIGVGSNHVTLNINGKMYDLSKFDRTWYRTGDFLFSSYELISKLTHNSEVKKMLSQEIDGVHDFYTSTIFEKPGIGNYSKNLLNGTRRHRYLLRLF